MLIVAVAAAVVDTIGIKIKKLLPGEALGARLRCYRSRGHDVTVVAVKEEAFADLDLFDFSKTAELIEAGRAAMDQYLGNPKPNTIRPLTAIGAQSASLQRMPRGGRPLRE